MSFADFVLIALLAAAVVFALKNIKKNKCTGDCMSCAKRCAGRKDDKKQE